MSTKSRLILYSDLPHIYWIFDAIVQSVAEESMLKYSTTTMDLFSSR